MKRRKFISFLGCAAVAPLYWPGVLYADQRTRRISILVGTGSDPEAQSWIKGFRQRLHDLGWDEGGNLKIDLRWGGADIDFIRASAAGFASAKPDVILVYSVRALNEVRRATSQVPVVFIATSDPVGLGYVKSLSRPAGNLTGFMLYEVPVAGKLVELLKEIDPRIARVGLLFSPDNVSAEGYWRSIETVGATLGVVPSQFPVRDAAGIQQAVDGFAKGLNGGLVLPTDVTTIVHRDLIIALASRHRLPVVYSFRTDATRGGLMSYGPNTADLFQRAAGYVDRILKGEKPADLPVQAPTKFDLVVNLKTAKTLGLNVPMSLLGRADEVIE
jgi:putative tryptophan/tyrosine transport system substrate-binding protein